MRILLANFRLDQYNNILVFRAERGEGIIYAIVEVGGKQYKVAPGDVFNVEKQTAAAGETVKLQPVGVVKDDGLLVVGNGLQGVSVTATVVGGGRGPKIRVFKYKHKANYRRRAGHRQDFTTLKLEGIQA